MEDEEVMSLYILSGTSFSMLLVNIDCTDLFSSSFPQVSERHYSFQIKGSLKQSAILELTLKRMVMRSSNCDYESKKMDVLFYLFFFKHGAIFSCIFFSLFFCGRQESTLLVAISSNVLQWHVQINDRVTV